MWVCSAVKKLWSWIKAFFSESRVIRPTGELSFDIKWANYDVDYLDTLLAASKNGADSGRVGLPAVDQVPPDTVEEHHPCDQYSSTGSAEDCSPGCRC